MDQSTFVARREFIKFLAASPYVAAVGGLGAFLEFDASAQQRAAGNAAASTVTDVLGAPSEALNVFDFEEAARRKVHPGHWAYMASGVDFDATLRANREGYSHVQLRPRRLHDATKVDMHVDLFGTVYNSPIFTCPTVVKNHFTRRASSPWRARPKPGGPCRFCRLPPRPASRT